MSPFCPILPQAGPWSLQNQVGQVRIFTSHFQVTLSFGVLTPYALVGRIVLGAVPGIIPRMSLCQWGLQSWIPQALPQLLTDQND